MFGRVGVRAGGLLLLGAGALLAAGTAARAIETTVNYTCARAGAVRVVFVNTNTENYVRLRRDGAGEVRLDPVDAGPGTKYSDGKLSLQIGGEDTIFNSGDGDEKCTIVEVAAQDEQGEPSPPAAGISSREAFESARDLGTVEAWEAFLKIFPEGFRADLARAYIKKLQREQAAAAPGSPRQAPPPRQGETPRQGEMPAGVRPRIAALPTVVPGPGKAPWVNKTFSPDPGAPPAYAASVQSNGVELVAYCTAERRVEIQVIEGREGVYPQFDARVSQGLKSSLGPDRVTSHIPLRFSSGDEYYLSVRPNDAPGNGMRATALRPDSRIVAALIAERTMRLSAPPFGATFQLKGSRDALCSVLSRCGAPVARCRGAGAGPVAAPDAGSMPAAGSVPVNPRSCPRGTAPLEGQCIRFSRMRSFCGAGRTPFKGRCIPAR